MWRHLILLPSHRGHTAIEIFLGKLPGTMKFIGKNQPDSALRDLPAKQRRKIQAPYLRMPRGKQRARCSVLTE